MRDAVYPDAHYRAYAERVIDGDSYHLRIDLGFHVAITIPCRLRDVNTPELGTYEGTEARNFMIELLRPANLRWDNGDRQPTNLLVQSYRDRQSFARWIVDAWIEETGVRLADLIVSAGHGQYVRGVDA